MKPAHYSRPVLIGTRWPGTLCEAANVHKPVRPDIFFRVLLRLWYVYGMYVCISIWLLCCVGRMYGMCGQRCAYARNSSVSLNAFTGSKRVHALLSSLKPETYTPRPLYTCLIASERVRFKTAPRALERAATTEDESRPKGSSVMRHVNLTPHASPMAAAAHQSHAFGQSFLCKPMNAACARPAASQLRARTVEPMIRTLKTFAVRSAS